LGGGKGQLPEDGKIVVLVGSHRGGKEVGKKYQMERVEQPSTEEVGALGERVYSGPSRKGYSVEAKGGD